MQQQNEKTKVSKNHTIDCTVFTLIFVVFETVFEKQIS